MGIVFAKPKITIAGIIAAIPCGMLMKEGMRKRKKIRRKEERIRYMMEGKLERKVRDMCDFIFRFLNFM